MRGKTTWIIASCLMGLALLVASCATSPAAAPTATTGAKGATAPTAAPTAPGKATAAATAPAKASPAASTEEKPKYGGTLNVARPTSPYAFDQIFDTFYKNLDFVDLTSDYVIAGDWAEGLAGTKRATFQSAGINDFTGTKNCVLCESWKIVEPGHFQFKIRKGVKFALDPNSEASKLVNGREMTAEDVAYNFNRFIKNNKYAAASEAALVAGAVVTVVNGDTVDVKVPLSGTLRGIIYFPWGAQIIPKEIIDKYGDMNDWKRVVGTGPYMISNYTSGSVINLVKNPNYWQTDPVGPGKGNKLPYIDNVNILILSDPSTRATAIRTGKLDMYSPLVRDDFEPLIKSTPQLKEVKLLGGAYGIYMRVDKQDLPFKDVRVRRALAMAIDYKGIVDKLMGGDGEAPGFPMAAIPDFKAIYTPLSELSKDVQEIYSYNPTKAKQLLAEAGYPNGFKADVLVNSTLVTSVDEVSVFKDAWSKIGVDLTLKQQENSAYNSNLLARNYDSMAYAIYGAHGIYLNMLNWVGDTVYNGTWNMEPKSQPAYDAMNDAIAKGDLPKADAIYKDFAKEMMGQVWTIPYPRPYSHTVWWPYLKNYHGETSVGYLNGFSWATFAWIDQDMKKSLGF
jgi:peptide/nickel transport system substrate-binding protein